nr:gag-asp_proteas domain-containing protein [Ipomoea batatas]
MSRKYSERIRKDTPPICSSNIEQQNCSTWERKGKETKQNWEQKRGLVKEHDTIHARKRCNQYGHHRNGDGDDHTGKPDRAGAVEADGGGNILDNRRDAAATAEEDDKDSLEVVAWSHGRSCGLGLDKARLDATLVCEDGFGAWLDQMGTPDPSSVLNGFTLPLDEKSIDGKFSSDGNKGEDKNQKVCWTCGGDHLQRNCPKGPKVAAITEENAEGGGSATMNCSPMQLLSTINTSAHNNPNHRLMYVDIFVNGVTVLAMVDTGASHNFVDERLVSHLNLNLEQNTSKIKTVNATARGVTGRAEVTMKVGDWEGSSSLIVMPLDDFDLILGCTFFVAAKAVVIPHFGGIMIHDERSPSFVKSVSADQNKRQGKGVAQCSAIQIDDGLKRGYDTYLAVMFEIEGDVFQDIPKPVVEVLEEFKDARWLEFIDEFDFDWVHRTGRHNAVADTLSRKVVEEYVTALTLVQIGMVELIREQASSDRQYV